MRPLNEQITRRDSSKCLRTLLPTWSYNAPETPGGYRSPGDDFFCLRYEVWYSSTDCAIRTRDRTCGGCFNCDQGRFNLKRHEAVLRRRAISRRFG